MEVRITDFISESVSIDYRHEGRTFDAISLKFVHLESKYEIGEETDVRGPIEEIQRCFVAEGHVDAATCDLSDCRFESFRPLVGDIAPEHVYGPV